VRQVLADHDRRFATVAAIREYPVSREAEILPLLIGILGEQPSFLGYTAAERLEEMIKRKPCPAGQLVAALNDDESSEQAKEANSRLCDVLASVSGYMHTVPAAGRAAEIGFWRQWWTRNKDKDRWGWLVEAVTSAPDNESRQSYALGTMAGLRDKRAVPYLLNALESPSGKIRYYAVCGLNFLDSGIADASYTYEKFLKEEAHIISSLRQKYGTGE
jgi:hypothetical protein